MNTNLWFGHIQLIEIYWPIRDANLVSYVTNSHPVFTCPAVGPGPNAVTRSVPPRLRQRSIENLEALRKKSLARSYITLTILKHKTLCSLPKRVQKNISLFENEIQNLTFSTIQKEHRLSTFHTILYKKLKRHTKYKTVVMS